MTPIEQRNLTAVEFGPYEWASIDPAVTLQWYLDGVRDRRSVLAAMSQALRSEDHADTCNHMLGEQYLCTCWRSFFEPYSSIIVTVETQEGEE